MRLPLFLFVLSICGLFAALSRPAFSDWAMVAGLCTVASAILLLGKWLRRSKAPENWAVVDGSNILHWREGIPDIATVREVVDALTASGLTPGVVFDANVGYKISDRYMNDKALASLLGLPVDRVMVAPKGTPADPLVLQVARDLSATIVTNDRFRDWVDDYPDVLPAKELVQGGYRNGALWLAL
ncbi:NYN domain-containing protein [Ruegeria atlantica]|uniref:NYN domain-containing protein n=1 Tax=Ruegeria atlantica TaxID=81569 RepID=UPI002494B504|nr:hypothetical protein [Ruegeria atlantica]